MNTPLVEVRVWEERDRLHINLTWDGETVAEWWDDDARQMFEDGFFKSGNLEDSVIRYAQDMKMLRHYIAGNGSHGCLYDNATLHRDRRTAVEALSHLFELGRTRKAQLRVAGYLELRPKDGADYCEIVPCDCCAPENHKD